MLSKILSTIISYPKKKKRLFWPVLSMIIGNIVALIIPLLVMKVMDSIKSKENIELGSVIIIMLAWLVAIIIVSLLEYYQRLSFMKYDNEILALYHQEILHKKSEIPLYQWLLENSKETADEIKKDLEDINSLLPGTIIPFIRNILLCIITTIILTFINLKLTLIIILLIPIFLLSYLLWDNKTKVLYKSTRKSSQEFLAALVEYLQSIPLTKVFLSSNFELQNMHQSFSTYLKSNYNYRFILNQRQTYNSIVSSFAPIYLAFCAFIFIFYKIATVGEIFAFWGIFSLNLSSISNISKTYLTLLNSVIIVEKFANKSLSEKNNGVKKKVIAHIEKIEVNNISISYNHDNIDKIDIPNFSLKENEIVQIIGESGIGKTTLLRLLLGLLKPSRGEVLINGYAIDEIDLSNLYSLVGYVEQNGYLYSRTIKDNILLGRAYDETNWERTIRQVRLDKFILNLKNRENELLGENGLQISGGEKQRILFARAIYHNPKWLFLDEPYTGIDELNQKEINKILNSIKKERTIIIVSHQKNMGLDVTRLIKLKNTQL